MRHTCLALAVSALLGMTATAGAQSTQPDIGRENTIEKKQADLAQARAAFPDYFAAAYARYPRLPAGLLEGVAYVQSRWVMLDGAYTDAAEAPSAIGLMGLYNGNGFRDQVAEAASLLGIARTQIEQEPYWNVMAAAALLSRAQAELPRGSTEAALLQAYAGVAAGKSAIDAFARESFAYDVLLSIDRGADDDGIRIASRAIDWEKQFGLDALVRQRAPFVRLDVSRGSVEVDGYHVDTVDETLRRTDPVTEAIESTDYGPALWVASPYFHARGQSITAVAIHTMQGSYAGSISWFQSNPSSVSAHYLIRSSDGQITQMVRESQAAHHIGSQNGYTLGIEHEGFVNNASWYTTAMYNASAALTRHFCSTYSISCASAYNGDAHSGIVVLAASVKVKGHQHFPDNTHTDPGINWDWRRYYTLLNPGSGGTTTLLDSFESSEGHFTSTPSYSGSTTGINATSTAERDCTIAKAGNCSEHLTLVDNPANTQDWAVRFLSGGGTPGSNSSVSRNGRVGFWVYVGGSGFTVGVGIDDGAATERSTQKAVAANTWTYVEWNLADAGQWDAWVGGNGSIDAASVTLDAIWLEHAHTTFTVNAYIDDVQWKSN
ncbi:N-acetylmuramoyl-L-alanine amidase [Tahibacter aquaticus]|uniref:N-acetylmuramoyl-L-alanine amidase n=1 Tax=Tahibacter aquaticus TaxID=520092 RepID=A0A4R6YZ84_9GAMM|nr:peptidoglycan recognition family protein [Tahibacter aquaticus]TDR44153.1 N-acetylmuramoyl-L-alanine amidase [Tahibacter aquaticus]